MTTDQIKFILLATAAGQLRGRLPITVETCTLRPLAEGAEPDPHVTEVLVHGTEPISMPTNMVFDTKMQAVEVAEAVFADLITEIEAARGTFRAATNA